MSLRSSVGQLIDVQGANVSRQGPHLLGEHPELGPQPRVGEKSSGHDQEVEQSLIPLRGDDADLEAGGERQEIPVGMTPV